MNASPGFSEGAGGGGGAGRKKVAIVLPPYDPLGAAGGGKSRYGYLPPLGAGYLAGVLRRSGHEVVFVDAMSRRLSLEAAAAETASHGADVVGISCMSTWRVHVAYQLAALLREKAPDAFLVMGGAHITSFGELALRQCPALDAAVPGEAEFVFAELVDALAAGRPPASVPGLILRTAEGGVLATEPAPLPRDLDAVPFPDRSIYDHRLYFPNSNLGLDTSRPATAMITSRGCTWNRCRFCFRGGFYDPKYRRRSPENVAEEAAQIVAETGVRQIKFLDDNFCINERWVDRFCGLLDERGLNIRWGVLGRVDTSTKSMLKRMAASGCKNIQFGIESGNQRLLDLIGKGTTLDQIREAVSWAKAAGLSVMGTCILGVPTETPEETDATIRFACELNIDYMFFFPYHPFHGTELAEMAAAEGTVFPEECEDFHYPIFKPSAYASREQLRQKAMEAYRRYYFRPAYWAMMARGAARNPYLLKNHAASAMTFLSMMSVMKGRSPAVRRRADPAAETGK